MYYSHPSQLVASVRHHQNELRQHARRSRVKLRNPDPKPPR